MKKILIAKDIEKVLRKKNSFLDRTDMLVMTAASHDEAWESCRAESPDLIITQADLPGMEAETFCNHVRERAETRRVPIIMICNHGKQVREQCLRMGANAVYQRPMKPSLVLAKARKLLAISLRETYRVLLQIAVEGNSCNEMFFCRTVDLSATGMLMETALSLRLGDRLDCSFYLPDDHTTHIQATGEIVRIDSVAAGSDANRYGIRFLDLTDDAGQALRSFLGAGPHSPR